MSPGGPICSSSTCFCFLPTSQMSIRELKRFTIIKTNLPSPKVLTFEEYILLLCSLGYGSWRVLFSFFFSFLLKFIFLFTFPPNCHPCPVVPLPTLPVPFSSERVETPPWVSPHPGPSRLGASFSAEAVQLKDHIPQTGNSC